MPEQPIDPIIEQRRRQRRLLTAAISAVHLQSSKPSAPQQVQPDREAEELLRLRLDEIVEGPAGEHLAKVVAADAAEVALSVLQGVHEGTLRGTDVQSASYLHAIVSDVPDVPIRTSDEPTGSLHDYIAVAMAADRLAEDVE